MITALRRLYFVRFGFAVVWAALVVATGSELGALGTTLLVVYPLFDVGAAVVDARSSRPVAGLPVGGLPVAGLYVNIVISLLAAAGLAFAGASGVPAVLRVWGAWAVAAGLVQLVVAVGRRRLGGQWPMILSGGLSTIAGTTFVLQAGSSDPTLNSLAGYATLGGIFFLVSAIRLRRAAPERVPAG
ncbi:hypothetical protein [Cryptosporangium sp. NPDC051539]|uniref:hypothetical protein n=1 Tax=Cryptosporangium sp. NPDC051539 TaxID=3363962 RepID=UPI003791B0FD